MDVVLAVDRRSMVSLTLRDPDIAVPSFSRIHLEEQ